MAGLPSSRLTLRVRHLTRAAQQILGRDDAKLAELSRELLAIEPGRDPLAGASGLNNDGTPLQLCFTATRRGGALRLIADPGTQYGDTEQRYLSARSTLSRSLEQNGAAALAPIASLTFNRLVPAAQSARSAYRRGFLWIAASPQRNGLALYVEMAPCGRARGWQAAADWLTATLPSTQAAIAALGGLREHCIVASCGLEGSGLEDGRAKVYFRLARPIALRELGLELLQSAEALDFLSLAMGNFGVELDGLVLSLGFHLATGEIADLKIDLCAHCLAYDAAGWTLLIEKLRSRFGFARLPVVGTLQQHACDVAFIGLGLDADRTPRLNLYLKPPAVAAAPGREEISAALDDGVRYLCALQKADGRWTDYQLPVGECDQWTTAYVGLALARCGAALGHGAARAAAAAAVDWLLWARTYRAGWGYNGITGPDADSTALVLALLREVGVTPAASDQAFLRGQWRPEGGMATYSGPGAWGTVHWDVTPLGYFALSEADRRCLRPEFLCALRNNRIAGGMWRSYWWRNPHYSTFTTLEVLTALGIAEPGGDIDAALTEDDDNLDNPFDLACLLGIRLFRSASAVTVGRCLHQLLAWQADDGRWPGHANLRVTDDTCYAPWDRPVGAYYADEAATITTSTVVRVLTHLVANGTAGGAIELPDERIAVSAG